MKAKAFLVVDGNKLGQSCAKLRPAYGGLGLGVAGLIEIKANSASQLELELELGNISSYH